MEGNELQNERLNMFLHRAKEYEATDLHLCPGSLPLMRVRGMLKEMPGAQMLLPPAINGIIDMLLDEKKRETLEKDRVLDFSFSRPGLGRFRANIYSQRGTYAIAVRMLPFDIPAIDKLGLPASVGMFTSRTKGLFLVTGPTGSGKSTTLASLLDVLNEQYQYHIITIEDPIEYLHKHKKSLMTQREIGEDADSFAQALRSALREDPDVIMVGEMRDTETISIALTAAETGHLVLSTLHTVDTAKSVDRIVDAFPPEQHNQVRSQLATVLEGVVSQQLIPRLDGKGMALASEVMFTNTAVRSLIREGKHYQINSVLQTGQAHGMQLLEADLARLCNEGIIDTEATLLHAHNPQLLQQFLYRR